MPFFFNEDPQGPANPTGSTSQIGAQSATAGVPLAGAGGYGVTDDPLIVWTVRPKITKSTNATVADAFQDSSGSTDMPIKDGVQYIKQSTLLRQFSRLDPTAMRHWAYMLALSGYAGGSNQDPEQAAQLAKYDSKANIMGYYANYLKDVAAANAYGQKVNPYQFMEDLMKYQLGDKYKGLTDITPEKWKSLSADMGVTADKSQAGTYTQTQKSVDYMNPEDAQALVRATLQRELGRDPTKAEYEDFVAAIRTTEAKNPTTSTSTYTTDEDGRELSRTTTTHGGLTQAGFDQAMYEKVKKMPSWAVWQAVGTYAPALFAALDSPISGV